MQHQNQTEYLRADTTTSDTLLRRNSSAQQALWKAQINTETDTPNPNTSKRICDRLVLFFLWFSCASSGSAGGFPNCGYVILWIFAGCVFLVPVFRFVVFACFIRLGCFVLGVFWCFLCFSFASSGLVAVSCGFRLLHPARLLIPRVSDIYSSILVGGCFFLM